MLGQEVLLDIFLQNSGIGTIGGLWERNEVRGFLEGSQLLTTFHAIFKVIEDILCLKSTSLFLRGI